MSDLAHWEALLKDPSPRIRAASLRRLAEEGGPDSGPLLRSMQQDRDELVRTVADEVYKRWKERFPPPPPPPPPAEARASLIGPARADGDLAALGAGVAPRVIDPRKIASDVLRPCVKRLLEICHSGAYDLARLAIMALGRIRDWSTVDGLLELLENQQLNAEVAEALAKIGDYRAVDPIIKVIAAGKWSNPKAIIASLGGFRTRSATLELVRFLQSPDPAIRSHACRALSSFTYDEEVEFSLLNSLDDADEEVVLSALMALKGVDTERTVQKLVELYRGNPNEKVRATVFTALHGSTKNVTSILAIVEEALADPNDRVRANAVESLSNMTVDPSALRTLLTKAAQDDNNRVLANVAIAFGKIDARESVSMLSNMIADPDKKIRASAVYAARFIQNERVAQWLLSMITLEKSQDVLQSALEGLAMIGGEGIVDKLLGFLSNPNPVIRRGITKALGTKKDKRVAPALVSRFSVEDDSEVCAEIVRTVGRIGGGEYLNFLSEALKAPDAAVQVASIEAQTELARLETIADLEPFLASNHPSLRARSALALWNLGQLDVADRIREMLVDLRNQALVAEAVDVMGKIGEGLQDMKSPKLVHLVSALKNYEEAVPVVEAPVGPVASRPPTSPGLAKVETTYVAIEEMDAIMNLLAMGETGMALDLAGKAVEDHPEDPLATYLVGKIRMRGNAAVEASEAFRKSQEKTNTFFPSSLNLARLAQVSGDLGGAFAAFLEAFRRKGKLIEQQIEMTEQLLAEKRHEEVSAMIKELLAQMPLEGGVYLKLGIRFLKAKRFAEAFDNLRRAYAFDGENNAVRFNLALACYHMGKAKECKLLCNRVLKSSPPESAEAQRALHLLELL